MAGTVQNFRDLMSSKVGEGNFGELGAQSEAFRKFSEKLNEIGWRNAERYRPSRVSNVDATVVLSQEEWNELKTELDQILAGMQLAGFSCGRTG